jgi:hypothetical protein
VNRYDVFGKCYKSTPAVAAQAELHESIKNLLTVNDDVSEKKVAASDDNQLKCLWTQPMIDYFNNQSVKASLNINPAYIADPWVAC